MWVLLKVTHLSILVVNGLKVKASYYNFQTIITSPKEYYDKKELQ